MTSLDEAELGRIVASVFMRFVRLSKWLYEQVPVHLMISKLVTKLLAKCSAIRLGLGVCLRVIGCSFEMF